MVSIVIPTYLSSSLPSEHKVNTRCRHSALFLALASASPEVRSRLFSSFSMVFRQVVFGLPLDLLPAGVHLGAIFGIDDLSILKTCPSHRSPFCRILFSIQVEFVNFSKFVFVMVFGQIFCRFVWGSCGGNLKVTSCLSWLLSSIHFHTVIQI